MFQREYFTFLSEVILTIPRVNSNKEMKSNFYWIYLITFVDISYNIDIS